MSKVTERSRLDKAKKERIIFLATQGLKYDEIAKEIGCATRQVSGYLLTAAHFGRIPKELATSASTRYKENRVEKSRRKMALAGEPESESVAAQAPVAAQVVAPQSQAQVPEDVQDQLDLPRAAISEGLGIQIQESNGDVELGLGNQDHTVNQDHMGNPVESVQPSVEAVVLSEESKPEPSPEPEAPKPEASLPEPLPVQEEPVPAAPVKRRAPKPEPEETEVAPKRKAAKPEPEEDAAPVKRKAAKPEPEETEVPVSVPLPVPPVVKAPTSLPERTMAVPAPSAPTPQPQIAPQAQVAPGWSSGGRFVPGYVGGFENASAGMRYQVRRVIPDDGIVGQHTGNFTELDLCNQYGEGFYKVLRFEPGRALPIEHEVKVGASFGAPRSPKYSMSTHRENRFARPHDEDGAAAAPRYERPSYGDRSLYEFARHQAQSQAHSVGNDVTAEAIRQLGEANKRAQEQAELSRKNGPDAFVANFFQTQNDVMYKRAEEEKKLAEQRRKDDDEKWERRQREVEAEHRRRQEEEEKRHARDIERIRYESESRQKAAENERKLMMDLEDKKLALIREEAKLRQDILQEELKANREAMKELQESTATQVDAVKEAMKRELEKDRIALEREHKIRERSLDKEHELSSKILDIKQESLQKQGGDQIFNLLDTVVKEFGQGLKQIVDLNKLQSMTPEAQAASVAGKSMDGNVVPETRRPETQAAESQQPEEVPGVASEAPAPQQEADGGRSRMDTIVQAMVEQPVFKQVLREWSRQVKMGEDPTAFAGMFLDWLQDPTDFNARKGCTMFVNFIKTRTWDEVLDVISPKLEREVLASFKSEHAEDFYEGFKAIVVEHVKMYFEEFLASRSKPAQEAAKPSAPAAVAQEAKEAPESENESENETTAEQEAPPVPTRAALRPVK